MIAPRSAAANPTSLNTSTAASRIFRRVASDRTWRAIAYYLRSSGCALSFRTMAIATILTWQTRLTGQRAGSSITACWPAAGSPRPRQRGRTPDRNVRPTFDELTEVIDPVGTDEAGQRQGP